MSTPYEVETHWDEPSQRNYHSRGGTVVGWQEAGGQFYHWDDAHRMTGVPDGGFITWYHESDPAYPRYRTDAQGEVDWVAGYALDAGQNMQSAPTPDVEAPTAEAPTAERPSLSELRMHAMNDVFEPRKGVHVKPILLVDDQHVTVADGAVFSSGSVGGGYSGGSYGDVDVPALREEMRVSAKDAEVGALDAVHQYLEEHYPPNSPQRDGVTTISVEFVSNIGPCNGCKCRFQEFAENMGREFPDARIRADAVYNKGDGSTRFMSKSNRGPLTEYGYAGPVEAFTNHAARDSRYPFVYYKREIVPRPAAEQRAHIGDSAHLMNAAGVNQGGDGIIPTTPPNPAWDVSPRSASPVQEAGFSVAAAAGLQVAHHGSASQQSQHQSTSHQSSVPVARSHTRSGGSHTP